MWGKVFSHESGYRGEFARIDSFFDVEGAGKVKGRTLEKLSEFYGAPIIQVSREQLFDAIDEMCEINRDRPMWLRKLDRKKVALSNRAGNYLARTLSHMLP